MLNVIVLTSCHAEDLEDASRKVQRKVQRRSRSPSPVQPINSMCELWVGLQVSVKRMTSVRYMHLKEWALESLCGPGQGFRVKSDQLLDNALNDIVLTSQHAGGLEDISTEVWGQPARCAGGWGGGAGVQVLRSRSALRVSCG